LGYRKNDINKRNKEVYSETERDLGGGRKRERKKKKKKEVKKSRGRGEETKRALE